LHEHEAEFVRADASAERMAAHERNRATRRLPRSIDTTQDFVDMYASNDALRWYDTTVNSAPLWDGVEVNIDVFWQLYAPGGFGDFALPVTDLPVFLGLGRYDYGIPYYLWDEPMRSLPNLRYRLYERSGHTPPYEQPAEFAADLVDWAQSL
jgi:proline iminopeptidase